VPAGFRASDEHVCRRVGALPNPVFSTCGITRKSASRSAGDLPKIFGGPPVFEGFALPLENNLSLRRFPAGMVNPPLIDWRLASVLASRCVMRSYCDRLIVWRSSDAE